MRKVKQLIIVMVLALVFPVAGWAEIPMPYLLISGDVSINDHPAPLDTEISAKIDGAEVAVAMVNEDGYLIKIPANKANEGKTIVFEVNGIVNNNNQCECADADKNPPPPLNLDLAVEDSSSEEDSDTSTGTGGGGGGGSSSGDDNGGSEPVQGDINEDGIIDFDDFSMFALLYGETYSIPDKKIENILVSRGDFDSDGDVDFDDFAIFALSYEK